MKLYVAEATVPKGAAPATLIPNVVQLGGQGRQGHPLPDDVQQRVPRDAPVSGAAAQHGRRRPVEKSQSPNPKIQIPTSYRALGFSMLGFWDSGFGIWDLGFGIWDFYRASHASGLKVALGASLLKCVLCTKGLAEIVGVGDLRDDGQPDVAVRRRHPVVILGQRRVRRAEHRSCADNQFAGDWSSLSARRCAAG